MSAAIQPAPSGMPWLALLAAVCFASLVFTLSAVAQQKGWVVGLTALGLMLGALTAGLGAVLSLARLRAR